MSITLKAFISELHKIALSKRLLGRALNKTLTKMEKIHGKRKATKKEMKSFTGDVIRKNSRQAQKFLERIMMGRPKYKKPKTR